jgi:hypothetical protein
MATATESAPPPAAIGLIPARGSWIDALIAWLDGRPGPAWMTYLGLAAIGLLVGNAIPWLDGKPPQLDGYYSVFGLFSVLELLIIRHLDRVGAEALVAFRPLLQRDDASFRALLVRFTTIPAVPAVVMGGFWVAGGLWATLTDLEAHRVLGVSAAAAALTVAMEIPINLLLAMFLLKATRHFLDVERIHREAPRIDLLEPAPLYGFARLTSQTALGLLLLTAVLIPTLAPTYFVDALEFTRLNFVVMIAVLVSGAVAIFVLPLYGMHRRIVAEKERLQGANGARLSAVLGELEQDVRTGELGRADGLNKQLASVLAERDLLGKLPTWPWQAATLRAFVSALLLPVLVYVLARAAERIVL